MGVTVKLDMTNEAYHLEPSLSASGAKTIALGSPAEYMYGEFKSSPAFDVGTATHTLVFEPQNAESIWCGPETRRGLDWKRKKLEAEEAGALLLTEADYRLAADMAEAVRSNRAAAELLSGDLGLRGQHIQQRSVDRRRDEVPPGRVAPGHWRADRSQDYYCVGPGGLCQAMRQSGVSYTRYVLPAVHGERRV